MDTLSTSAWFNILSTVKDNCNIFSGDSHAQNQSQLLEPFRQSAVEKIQEVAICPEPLAGNLDIRKQ